MQINKEKLATSDYKQNFLISFIDNPVSSMLNLQQGSTVSDLSNDSSPAHGYPDFPPSPDSWLGNENNTNNNSNNPSTSTTNSTTANNQSSSHY